MAIDGTALANTIKANLDAELGDATFPAERQALANAVGEGVAAAHNADAGGGVLPIYSGAPPAADASWRGRLVIVRTADLVDQVQCCVLNSSGGYEWVIVQQSS